MTTKTRNSKNGSLKNQKQVSKKRDYQQEIADKIINLLEKVDQGGWKLPWQSDVAAMPLRSTGEPYQGINSIALWAAAMERGFSNPYWFTYRQALALGACVRKGETGEAVIKFGISEKNKKEDSNSEEDTSKKRFFVRGYTVFNADQIENLPEQFLVKIEPVSTAERLPVIDKWIDATGANIQYGGNSALYSLVADTIRSPLFEQYPDPEGFYTTLFHELGHWTGHPKRLDRNFGAKTFGDEGYSQEELVAEFCCAYIGGHFGTVGNHIESHAQYIKGWCRAIKNDKKFLFVAAREAQKAANYLLDLTLDTTTL